MALLITKQLQYVYIKNGAPDINDDDTKGFIVGHQIQDESVTPNVLYHCDDNSTGAAVWTEIGHAESDYWQSSGGILSPSTSTDTVRAELFEQYNTDLADNFMSCRNDNASIDGKAEFGLGMGGGYSVRIYQDLSGTPTYNTPFHIDKDASDYAFTIREDTGTLFNTITSTESGINFTEWTTNGTSKWFKWTDDALGKYYKTGITPSTLFATSDALTFNSGSTSGVVFQTNGGSTFLHLGNGGDMVSAQNSYRGFNGYYNGGWKVMEDGFSAYIFKHSGSNNIYNEYLSTTTVAGDSLALIAQGRNRNVSLSQPWYFTRQIFGMTIGTAVNAVVIPVQADDVDYDTGIIGNGLVADIRIACTNTNLCAKAFCDFGVITIMSYGSASAFSGTRNTAGRINIYNYGGTLRIQNKNPGGIGTMTINMSIDKT